jgi:hypothetical protein
MCRRGKHLEFLESPKGGYGRLLGEVPWRPELLYPPPPPYHPYPAGNRLIYTLPSTAAIGYRESGTVRLIEKIASFRCNDKS